MVPDKGVYIARDKLAEHPKIWLDHNSSVVATTRNYGASDINAVSGWVSV